MNAKRFAELLRSFSASSTRQSLVRALAGLSLGGALGLRLAPDDIAARKKHRKRKKCKGKKRCGKKCVPKGGCCTAADCGGGKVCVGNVCACANTCPPDHIPSPETCACCRLNGVVADDCDADPCCSDLCSPYVLQTTICLGRELGKPCSFDEQCASPFTCNAEHVCA